MSEAFFVYILTNTHCNVFYVGVTNDLIRRVFEHKNKLVKGFSYRYNVDKLVYYEIFGSIELAILHEKRVKRWARPIKCDAIARINPEWKDLYSKLTESSEEEITRHPGLVPGSPETTKLCDKSDIAVWQEIPGHSQRSEERRSQPRDDSFIDNSGVTL